MKNLITAITIALICTMAISSCKTSEKNYRSSYDQIIEKRASMRTAEDSLITGDFYSQGRQMSFRLDGDTLRTRVDYILTEKINPADSVVPPLERFYTVVGQFRQVFNARAMATRLQGLGFEPVIVHNNVPEYFVCLNPTSMAIDALTSLRHVSTDSRLQMRPPCPWTLQAAQRSR